MKAAIFFLLAIVFKCFSASPAPCNDLLDSGNASYAVFDNLKALDYYAKAYKRMSEQLRSAHENDQGAH